MYDVDPPAPRSTIELALKTVSGQWTEKCRKANPNFDKEFAEMEEEAQRKIQAAELRAKMERTRGWVAGTVPVAEKNGGGDGEEREIEEGPAKKRKAGAKGKPPAY